MVTPVEQPTRNENLGCGCLHGFKSLILGSSRQGLSRSIDHVRTETTEADAQQLQSLVQESLRTHMESLHNNLNSELNETMSRLMKAHGKSSPPTHNFKISTAPCFSQGGHHEEPMSPKSRRSSLQEDYDSEGSPELKRNQKRRWTSSSAVISLSAALAARQDALRSSGPGTPASTVVSDHDRDDDEITSQATSCHSSRASSRRQSISDAGHLPERRSSRISFLRVDLDGEVSKVNAVDSEESSDEEPSAEAKEVTPKAASEASSSSLLWRQDALDVGENLAASTAVKRGSASVESIIALVQTERERWELEKQNLETRLEDLKEELRAMQSKHRPDAEKEALKKQYQELRKAMKERSRFGAWVCERHMQESDDEEEPNRLRSAEKEELRHDIAELTAKIRAARMLENRPTDASPPDRLSAR
eukprot:TRINITY_DN18268_c0_g1_i1.p1 TRINITY_DN18268_c0_g1~~TRINITY_DN18268_c0_g1_i1.p1  ORF type:complete len:421 (-),score=59.71 TRINITY_DN18268_c0_g1_i1:443-1705(-)